MVYFVHGKIYPRGDYDGLTFTIEILVWQYFHFLFHIFDDLENEWPFKSSLWIFMWILLLPIDPQICRCLIKTHDLLMCNIIKTMPYNGCSQMVSISLKMKESFIAHPWWLLSVVGLEEYSAHDWRAATSVQRASVTWREWGLWL